MKFQQLVCDDLESEMGDLGRRYAPRLVELGFGDLMRLLRLDDEDLEDILMHEYVVLLHHYCVYFFIRFIAFYYLCVSFSRLVSVGASAGHAKIFVAKVRAKRLENVRF
jgi:hypothetical protein